MACVRDRLIHGFYLGDILVEPLTGKVSGPGVSAHLPSKAVEVLLCLATSDLELLSRDDLLREVWGEGRGSEEALSHAVSELRHCLGDHHDDPKFIQTIPTRGYRLLVEPRLVGDVDANAAAPEPSPEGTKSTFLKDLLRRGVVQAGAAFLVVGWLLIQVAEAVAPIIGLPYWVQPFVTYVVIGGFPVLLVLAWFLEFAEGRFYLDRDKESPTVTTGLERNYLTIVAAYVIAAFGAAIYQLTAGFELPDVESGIMAERSGAIIPIEPNSIAVLPFLNIDGSDATRIFSDGLAEDVLDRLAKIPGLLVSSRSDSWSLPVNASSEQVRNRLRVAYFVEGSTRLDVDDLRVVVQLIDTATGFHRISRSFDRKLAHFADLQKEITNLIVANLRVALPPDTQMELATSYESTDVDAYVLYRRGRELFELPQNEESLAKVADLYMQALDVDPGYAAAHAGLCVTYAKTFELNNDSSFIDKAEGACATGLATNSNLHMVYSALGKLYLLTGRDADGEAAYLRALDINSQDVAAMLGLADAYQLQQKTAEAEDLLNEAIRLQPGNWRTIDTLGALLFSTGRYLEAAEAYAQVVLLDPNNWQGLGNRGSALLMAGNLEAAATALQHALDIEPYPMYYSNLGIIYYYLGEFEEAVNIHRKVVEISPDSSSDWLNLADALAFSNQAYQAEIAFRTSAELSEKMLSVNPRDARTLYRLAWASAMLGNQDYARELLGRSKTIAPNNPYVHYHSALIHSVDQDYDAAIDDLERAVAMGYPVKMLAVEPYLAELHDVAGFVTLISSVP